MLRPILVGIAAGLASALLFMAPISGSILAFPLFILTPLPVAIAGLGWGVTGGLIAAASGAVVIAALLPGVIATTIFLAIFAGPVVWLARLATMSRLNDANDPSAGIDWYPLGSVLLHAAIAVSAGLVVTGFVTGYDPAIIAEGATRVVVEFMTEVETTGPPPTAESVQPFVSLYIAILPFTVAAFMLAVTVFNLWLGGIVARASGRMARPAERLWTVNPPNEILISFSVALVLATLLPGAIGNVAALVAGAFGCALALVGLAVLHAVTLGMVGRGIILTAAYVLTFFSGLPLVLFAALGAAENFIHLRARRFAGAPPT